jgi:hypothetical protein
MIKKVIILAAVIVTSSTLFAQQYVTKNGHIKFFSEMPSENIEANNKQVNTALNTVSGEFIFKVLMKSFEFEKRLMQEHFNENYVESDKFPNATFKGRVANLGEIDFSKNGTYPALIEGDLTLHGVTKKVSEKGEFIISNGKIRAKSNFKIRVADYDIVIPKMVRKNIAELLDITVDVSLLPYKK